MAPLRKRKADALVRVYGWAVLLEDLTCGALRRCSFTVSIAPINQAILSAYTQDIVIHIHTPVTWRRHGNPNGFSRCLGAMQSIPNTPNHPTPKLLAWDHKILYELMPTASENTHTCCQHGLYQDLEGRSPKPHSRASDLAQTWQHCVAPIYSETWFQLMMSYSWKYDSVFLITAQLSALYVLNLHLQWYEFYSRINEYRVYRVTE